MKSPRGAWGGGPLKLTKKGGHFETPCDAPRLAKKAPKRCLCHSTFPKSLRSNSSEDSRSFGPEGPPFARRRLLSGFGAASSGLALGAAHNSQ